MPDNYQEKVTKREQLGGLLLRESRRSHFWRAAIVGILAGSMAVLFQFALNGAEVMRQAVVHLVGKLGSFSFITTIVYCAILAGAAGFITCKYCPEAKGSGIPHVKAVLLNIRRFRWLPVLVTKFVGGFLAIAAGLSLGREGPTVHMGAAIGHGLASRLQIPRRSYRTLIASGAGAGLSAAFNAPLAGFLFVLEQLQRELTPVTYGTALIATVCADAVTRIFIGQRAAFHIIGYDTPSMTLLPWILILGCIAGGLGILFNRGLISGLNLMEKLGWWKAVAVGALAGVVVIYVPEIAGGGHGTAELVLSGNYKQIGSLGILSLLLLAKVAFTIISYGAGVPGGIFAPMLVIGAFTGLLYGEALNLALPNVEINSAAFAVIGMAALFSATVRAPLSGIVLIIEMTGNYEQIYALIVASLGAYLVAEAFKTQPIYETLLERDLTQPDPATHGQSEPVFTEVYVEPGSALAGREVENLDLPDGCILLSVLRGTNEFVPPPQFHIHTGDICVFLMETPDARLTHKVHQLAKSSS